MKIFLKFIFLLLLTPSLAYSSEFIRSTEYVVSPDISFNQAKENAIQQMKIDILSEVGSYIESEISSSSVNGDKTDVINYSQISTGNIKVSILNQAFDGEILFLEVKAIVNEQNILKDLGLIVNIKNKDKEISSLIERLSNLEKNKNLIITENKLLKVKLNALRNSINVLEKSKTTSDEFSERITQIRILFDLLKYRVKHRIKNEIDIYNERTSLVDEVIIEGMTISEFNSIFPVENVETYISKKFNKTLCRVLEDSKYYLIARKAKNGRDALYLLQVDETTGIITSKGLYTYKFIRGCFFSLIQ